MTKIRTSCSGSIYWYDTGRVYAEWFFISNWKIKNCTYSTARDVTQVGSQVCMCYYSEAIWNCISLQIPWRSWVLSRLLYGAHHSKRIPFGWSTLALVGALRFTDQIWKGACFMIVMTVTNHSQTMQLSRQPHQCTSSQNFCYQQLCFVC